MKHRTARTILAFGLASALAAPAPAQNLTEAIARQMDGLSRAQVASVVPQSELNAAPEEALAALAAYADSPTPLVRNQANALAALTALAAGSPAQRIQAADQLARALADKDPLVSQGAARRLLEFRSADFSPAARAAIRERLDAPSPSPDVVRLAGLAPSPGVETRLRELTADETAHEKGAYAGRWYTTAAWAARLALARLGSAEDADRCISLVRGEKEQVTRVSRLLGDLAYVGTDAALAVVAEVLLGGGELPPAEPGVKPVPEAQYAIDFLARAVAGFPVSPEYPGGYDAGEIELGREWAKTRFGTN